MLYACPVMYAAALLIAAEPNLAATTGIDRACGFEQLEAAPEYK